MGMHADWKAAKKESEDKFTKAYDNWIQRETDKAQKGDPKARKKVLDEALKKAGLDKGPKYTSYMKFDEGFGKELDALDKLADEMAANDKKVDSLKLADVLKNKKLSSLLQHYCEKTAHIPENYDFVTSGIKMKPQDIYNTYIKPGSPKQLNIDSSEVDKWRACEESGNWKPAEQLRKNLLPTIVGFLNDRFPGFLNHKTYRRFIVADLGKGMSAMEKQIESVRGKATDYGRQVQAYGKRWKEMEPDFWTPLNVALNNILTRVDKIEKNGA